MRLKTHFYWHFSAPPALEASRNETFLQAVTKNRLWKCICTGGSVMPTACRNLFPENRKSVFKNRKKKDFNTGKAHRLFARPSPSMTHIIKELYQVRPNWFQTKSYVPCKPCIYLTSILALSPNRPNWAFTTRKSRFFHVKLCASRPMGFEPESLPLRVASSTTPPITHLCLY